MQTANSMELIGRIAAAMGISLVLTILLMALYQVDQTDVAQQAAPTTIAESR